MTGMNLELYLAFVAASTILIVIPGPNVLLVISTALKDGVRPALLTVAGTSSAMVLQLTVAVGGLTSLVLVLSEWFEILRWVGVIYLAYLGVQTLREKPAGTAAGAPPKAADRVPFARGFLVSLTNPKTLLFFAAFLLQFVDASLPPAHQLLVLAITFVTLATMLNGSYAVLARHTLRERLARSSATRWRTRLSGLLLLGASVGLALTRRS